MELAIEQIIGANNERLIVRRTPHGKISIREIDPWGNVDNSILLGDVGQLETLIENLQKFMIACKVYKSLPKIMEIK